MENDGGANTWSGMSLDIKRGWIFVLPVHRHSISGEAIATAGIFLKLSLGFGRS